MEIRFDKKFLDGIQSLMVIAITADVQNIATSPDMSIALDEATAWLKDSYTLQDLNKRPGIAATRRAYKAFGKDPNRYRPSAEALSRRVLRDMELYRISNLVDLINILSLRSGYSIGGFDLDCIEGSKITLGVGAHDEPFDAIGRGCLNIEGLPVYRDDIGGIGTPTSDHERTKLSLDTQRILICINIYEEDFPIEKTINLAVCLLKTFADAQNIEIKKILSDNY